MRNPRRCLGVACLAALSRAVCSNGTGPRQAEQGGMLEGVRIKENGLIAFWNKPNHARPNVRHSAAVCRREACRTRNDKHTRHTKANRRPHLCRLLPPEPTFWRQRRQKPRNAGARCAIRSGEWRLLAFSSVAPNVARPEHNRKPPSFSGNLHANAEGLQRFWGTNSRRRSGNEDRVVLAGSAAAEEEATSRVAESAEFRRGQEQKGWVRDAGRPSIRPTFCLPRPCKNSNRVRQAANVVPAAGYAAHHKVEQRQEQGDAESCPLFRQPRTNVQRSRCTGEGEAPCC